MYEITHCIEIVKHIRDISMYRTQGQIQNENSVKCLIDFSNDILILSRFTEVIEELSFKYFDIFKSRKQIEIVTSTH